MEIKCIKCGYTQKEDSVIIKYKRLYPRLKLTEIPYYCSECGVKHIKDFTEEEIKTYCLSRGTGAICEDIACPFHKVHECDTRICTAMLYKEILSHDAEERSKLCIALTAEKKKR